MLPSSEVISTNSKRCCRTNNSTTNYLFFQEFRHKKNKNLTNHINNAWDLSMFDDYKRLTDVVQGCSRLDTRFKVGQFSDLWLAHLL